MWTIVLECEDTGNEYIFLSLDKKRNPEEIVLCSQMSRNYELF